MHRFLNALEKDQSHAVSRRNGNKLAAGFAALELRRSAHELIELLHHLALLVDQQFRITHHVHEQNVRDRQMRADFQFSGHRHLDSVAAK